MWQSETAKFLDASENKKVDGGDSTFAGCVKVIKGKTGTIWITTKLKREREIDALPCSMLKLSHAR